MTLDLKVFGKWSCRDVVVSDPGLKPYINLELRVVLHNGGRLANKRFGKEKYHIVERLANKLMVTGHSKDTDKHIKTSGRDCGRKLKALKFVMKAFELIEKRTKENPIQVLVRAIENCAVREEITRFRQGGIIVQKAVDTAPLRRVDLALRFITHGAAQRAFKRRKSIWEALADEIIAAANYDTRCYSVAKKEEIERIAASSR